MCKLVPDHMVRMDASRALRTDVSVTVLTTGFINGLYASLLQRDLYYRGHIQCVHHSLPVSVIPHDSAILLMHFSLFRAWACTCAQSSISFKSNETHFTILITTMRSSWRTE